jgi:hypothetical protein
MQNVATNCNCQALKLSEMSADSQRIKQRLRGVFMLAVTRIDHRARYFLRQQFNRAR